MEVLVNSQYDIFANIESYQNLSEEAKLNRNIVTSKEYKKIKKAIEDKNIKINERVITKKSDIKDTKIFNNGILYKTDLNLQQEGKYKITMLFVDENFNIDEKDWIIEVKPSGQLVNSGGTVTCEYPNSIFQNNEAYTVQYFEVYTYDENKLVTSSSFNMNMTFNEDYDTNDNVNNLINEINKKYESYMKQTGVVVNIQPTNDSVSTSIVIDFNAYDIKNDPLNLLESKNTGKLKIDKIIEKNKDKAVCNLH
ncbi:hypothetical protein EOM09_04480 [bacterium]|nr:hypothetical protein [bacterium]